MVVLYFIAIVSLDFEFDSIPAIDAGQTKLFDVNGYSLHDIDIDVDILPKFHKNLQSSVLSQICQLWLENTCIFEMNMIFFYHLDQFFAQFVVI